MKNMIQNKEPIELRCSGNQRVMAIVGVETIVIHQFDFDILVHDLRL